MKKLKSILVASISTLLLLGCKPSTKTAVYNEGIHIIPAPLELVKEKGSFALKDNFSFEANTPETQKIAAFFTDKIKKATGFQVSTNESNGDIAFILDPSMETKKEGYTLDVASKKVTIKAKTPAGIFYGMQSFMQLLPAEIESTTLVENIAWNAPCVKIKDEPRFNYRGMMIDACRHFVPVESIKKQLDVLALLKINNLHWHLTEDQGWRIEIKKYPKLTEIGSKRTEGDGSITEGFYTQEQIKEVVAYAAERFITIVPELELPGHEMGAIAAYPSLACPKSPVADLIAKKKIDFKVKPSCIWGVKDIVMCPGKEDMFIFVEDVIKEMVELFPGTYFHIGGDECPKTSWKSCPLCQARIRAEHLKGDKKHSKEERLQSYVIGRVEKILEKYGKKMIGWDEILEGGLSPNATVMSWRGEQGGINAALQDHDVIMTPGSGGLYIDHYQGDSHVEPVGIGGYAPLSKTYSYNPTPDTLCAIGKEHYIQGVQANLWTEYIYTMDLLEYRAYPRVVALSEIAWSSLENKDFTDFCRRLNNFSVRLDMHNINYHIPQPEQPGGSSNRIAFIDKASIEFTTTRPIDMVYTLDGSEPTATSTKYVSPIEITETTTLKIRSLMVSGKMSKTRTIEVVKEPYAPAEKVEKATAGLMMKKANGTFLHVADLEKVEKWETKTIKSLRELTQQSPDSNCNYYDLIDFYSAIAEGYVNIPEDGIYFFSTDNDELWIDNNLIICNKDQVKRHPRTDTSVALAKGLHKIKVVFLGNVIGGWPSLWNSGNVLIRKSTEEKFAPIQPEQLKTANQ